MNQTLRKNRIGQLAFPLKFHGSMKFLDLIGLLELPKTGNASMLKVHGLCGIFLIKPLVPPSGSELPCVVPTPGATLIAPGLSNWPATVAEDKHRHDCTCEGSRIFEICGGLAPCAVLL